MHPSESTRHDGRPNAVLLAGLTGSGKTTLASALAQRGYERLSVDEEVFAAHGRYGIDYPEDTYFAREAPVVEAIRARFGALLRAGRDVVLDVGLWTREDRTQWQRLAHEAGAHAVLVYLQVGREELWRRLEQRNLRSDANALTVTASALDDFIDRFEPPQADERVLVYDGDVDSLSAQIGFVARARGQADDEARTGRRSP